MNKELREALERTQMREGFDVAERTILSWLCGCMPEAVKEFQRKVGWSYVEEPDNEARRWIESMRRTDGSLLAKAEIGLSPVFYMPGSDSVFLGGKFTGAQLRALADFMEENGG